MNLARSHAERRGFSKLSLLVFDGTRAVNQCQRPRLIVTGRSPIIKLTRYMSQATCF